MVVTPIDDLRVKKSRKKFCMTISLKLCIATGGLLKNLRIALQSTLNLALTIQPILHKYNAQLQRDLTIILVGGGSSFQAAGLAFYNNLHPDVEKQCIIKHCYLGFNLDLKQFKND